MQLAIHLAAVADSIDAHNTNLVGNLVNHAIVAYADAPLTVATLHFLAARRTGTASEAFDAREDAGHKLVR